MRMREILFPITDAGENLAMIERRPINFMPSDQPVGRASEIADLSAAQRILDSLSGTAERASVPDNLFPARQVPCLYRRTRGISWRRDTKVHISFSKAG